MVMVQGGGFDTFGYDAKRKTALQLKTKRTHGLKMKLVLWRCRTMDHISAFCHNFYQHRGQQAS